MQISKVPTSNHLVDPIELLGDHTFTSSLKPLGWKTKFSPRGAPTSVVGGEILFFPEAERRVLTKGATTFSSRKAIGEEVYSNGDCKYFDDGDSWFMLGKTIHLRALQLLERYPRETEIDFLNLKEDDLTDFKGSADSDEPSSEQSNVVGKSPTKGIETSKHAGREVTPPPTKKRDRSSTESPDCYGANGPPVAASSSAGKRRRPHTQQPRDLHEDSESEDEQWQSATASSVPRDKPVNATKQTPPSAKVTGSEAVENRSGAKSIPYQVSNLTEDTKQEMRNALGKAAWQLWKDGSVDEDAKKAAKMVLKAMREDEDGARVWADISIFTKEVPHTPEEARDVLDALVSMIYT